jgi:hypothetical protein
VARIRKKIFYFQFCMGTFVWGPEGHQKSIFKTSKVEKQRYIWDLSYKSCKLGWVFLQFCRNWSRLALKKLWWVAKSIFGISEQFAIRKSTISIYRAISIFHMRIFNLQGLGFPTNLKQIKKLSTQKLILHLISVRNTTEFAGSTQNVKKSVGTSNQPIRTKISPKKVCLVP